MAKNNAWINNIFYRILQHILFWFISFFIFLHLFKIGPQPQSIDYVYTSLFHLTLIPCVSIHLLFLLPNVKEPSRKWWINILLVFLIILIFSWLNYSFFKSWSNLLLPDYFFISYFSFYQIFLFFLVYIIITSLLKLSKSWFILTEVQNRLLLAGKEKAEIELLALRAQMNPHFIFNCLNSIKSLISNNEPEKSILYLTVFSKLIRNIFQNSDKRHISLFDELETCKLYTELEAMRLNGKLNYQFSVDPNLDLKSIMIPALIIQPFIENAIWHGIVPKDSNGKVLVSVKGENNTVICEVDDDGIGRDLSIKNKPVNRFGHQSKGVQLSKTRLDLEKIINNNNASINIIDKKINGKSSGTRVMLEFNFY
jgi:sensor histidine kinase YesM